MDEDYVQSYMSEDVQSNIRTETVESYYDYENSDIYESDYEESKDFQEKSEDYESDFEMSESEEKQKKLIIDKIKHLNKQDLLRKRISRREIQRLPIFHKKIEFLKLGLPKKESVYDKLVDENLVSKLKSINLITKLNEQASAHSIKYENDLLKLEYGKLQQSKLISRKYDKLISKLANY